MTMKTAVLALTLGLVWPLCAGAAESVPTRGMTMTQVKARFGPPQRVRAPVGQPPITRWYYPGFTVYFERNLTLDTVINPAHATRTTSTANNNAGMNSGQPGDRVPRTGAAPRHGPIDRDKTDDHRSESLTPPMPAPSRDRTGPTDPPSADGQEPATRSLHPPASSATRAERQQKQASSQFRFNPRSGRIEIVNDAPSADHGTDGTGGSPSSTATQGHSTQPATNVSIGTDGTDTVAQPPNATGAERGNTTK